MRGDGEEGVFILSQLGGSLWRGSPRPLITACWSTLQMGKQREERKNDADTEKYRNREDSQNQCTLTFLLKSNIWPFVKKTQQTLFHGNIDDVFVVIVNVQ